MTLTASAQLYPRITPRRREIFLLAYRPGARAWAAIKAPGAAVGKLITGVDKLADDSAMAMLDWRG